MVGGVPEVAEVDEPDEDADDGDDLREHVAEVIELALQRRLFANLRADALVDVANGSAVPGIYYDSGCVAVYDGSALPEVLVSRNVHESRGGTHGKDDVRHVLFHRPRIFHRVHRLVYTLALSREDGLVNTEAARGNGEHPAIRRNLVANGNGNDVSRDELQGMNARNLAIPKDLGFIRRVLLQSL